MLQLKKRRTYDLITNSFLWRWRKCLV